MKDQQYSLNLSEPQSASPSSDSNYILQTRSLQIIDRPRFEHLKYYILGKLRPYQIPLLAALVLLSLAIILRKLKRKKSRS